nr:cyclic AMP-dependent transcription factor ATF-6 alpha isoform X1 [Nomia melanderi]XP_031848385.1 cyclic AMP-dependent transcription factor ATF-6 alpha isoform X1 [Nomia melanderi]XP_031848386.1 cyclic AMP-dependent transcription factor ATF-6 alpha isoform X1 [Nomia melanderi]
MLINQDPQWNGVTASEIQIFPDLELMDGDCLPLSDDLFQSLSSELSVPLFIEDETPSQIETDFDDQITNDVSFGEHTSCLEDFDVHTFQQSPNINSNFTNDVKTEIKLEPASPYMQLPLSPVSSHSESSTSESQMEVDSVISLCDFKPTPETPPISPPQNISPSTSPEPIFDTTIGKQVRLMPIKSQDGKCTKFVLSKANSAKHVRVQPKRESTNNGQPRNTILLNSQNFVTFAQKTKQNCTSYPFVTHLLSTDGNIKAQNSVQFSPVQIKAEASTAQISQEKYTNTADVYIPGRESGIGVTDRSLILRNDTNGCTSIVMKNDSPGCRPILIKTEHSNYTPIVIKNEAQSVNFTGRQENEIKALKRQQRMIKNRESACLSRKKKKEYVSSLEKQICKLQEENKQLMMENTNLKQKLSALENTMGTNNKHRSINLSANKKNVAILLGMALMISLNVNTFSNVLSKNNHLNVLPVDITTNTPYIRHGRTLLWTSKDQIQEDHKESFRKNISVLQPMCPMYINKSESIRLDYELRRWIGGDSDQDNRITPKSAKFDAKFLEGLLSSPYVMQKKVKEKHNASRKTKAEMLGKTTGSSISNAVEVFSPTLKEHASLFEALGRRDDTFYVVWFSGEHLLLPASRKNSTGRPKMSLVLPALPTNETFSTPANHITMMQIDCEVTNTQLLHLQQSVIPNHLKNSNRSGNQTRQTPVTNDISNSVTEDLTKNYRPYFIKESSQKIFHKRNLKDIYEFNVQEMKPEISQKGTQKTESSTKFMGSQKNKNKTIYNA